MIQTVIKLQAKDQYLKLVSRPTLASGGIGVGKFEVEFSEHWEGYTDYFIIIAREDDAPDAEPRAYSMDESNSCTFPADEMARPGIVKVGLCGKLVTEEQNLIRTTTPVTVRVSEGQIAEVVDPIPTRNIYQYLTKQYEGLDVRVKALEDLLKEAEGGITVDLTNYYNKQETEKFVEDRIKKGIEEGEFGGPDEIYVGEGDMPEGAVLQFELDGEDIDIPDGENCQCHDEIYVGDGEMPEDATIQIIVDETDEPEDSTCVKSVNGTLPDENGNVVVPIGGGSGGMEIELIHDIVVEESVNSMNLDMKKNGKPVYWRYLAFVFVGVFDSPAGKTGSADLQIAKGYNGEEWAQWNAKIVGVFNSATNEVPTSFSFHREKSAETFSSVMMSRNHAFGQASISSQNHVPMTDYDYIRLYFPANSTDYNIGAGTKIKIWGIEG